MYKIVWYPYYFIKGTRLLKAKRVRRFREENQLRSAAGIIWYF